MTTQVGVSPSLNQSLNHWRGHIFACCDGSVCDTAQMETSHGRGSSVSSKLSSPSARAQTPAVPAVELLKFYLVVTLEWLQLQVLDNWWPTDSLGTGDRFRQAFLRFFFVLFNLRLVE